jgi:regulator of cell morphogenesis and NO signaling
MPDITATMTVDEVLRQWPTTAPVLNRFGLDLCCGGVLALGVAAASAGVDPQQLLAELKIAAGRPV